MPAFTSVSDKTLMTDIAELDAVVRPMFDAAKRARPPRGKLSEGDYTRIMTAIAAAMKEDGNV